MNQFKTWLVTGLLIALGFLGGCKDQTAAPESVPPQAEGESLSKQPSAEPVVPKSAETKPAPESPVAETPEQSRLSKLEKVYLDLFCANRSGAGEASLKLFSAQGFKDAADWSSQWHEEALANPEWAAKVTEKALNTPCTPSPSGTTSDRPRGTRSHPLLHPLNPTGAPPGTAR